MKPLAVHDLAAADAWLKAAQLSWFDSLTEDEREALADYKGRAGRLMNRSLRGEPGRSEVASKAAHLRRALERASAPADMLLYRGMGQQEIGLYRARYRGDMMRATAFVSTSLSAGVAAATAKAQGGVVAELVVHRGQKGVAYINPFPTYRYRQYEVLLNAGSVLKVLQADDVAVRLEVGDDDGNK